MKKLKLEDLTVESFTTTGRLDRQGTVIAHDSEGYLEPVDGDIGGGETAEACNAEAFPTNWWCTIRPCTYLMTHCRNVGC